MSVNVYFNGDATRLKKATDEAQSRIARFEKQTVSSLKNVNERGLKVMGGGFLSLAAGAAALGAAVKASADLKSLELGLASVAEESVNLEAHINDLKEAAKKPGLGFEEALAGSLKLQAVDFSSQKATRSLVEFGNAVALSGKGAPELERITTQLGQLSSKGKVLSQDLRPIIEAAPVVGKALKAAFGTVAADDINKQVKDSTEFIDILLDSLAELPRALETPKSKFQNLGDASKRALAKIGDPIVDALVPALDGLVETLDGSEGGLEAFGEALGGTLTFLVKITPALTKFAGAYIAFKVAQKGVKLAASILKAVDSVKKSVLATQQETVALKLNTAAQRANAAARGGLSNTALKGNAAKQLPSLNSLGGDDRMAQMIAKSAGVGGKRSAREFYKAYSAGLSGKFKSSGGALGVSAVGAISTSLLPESALLGGKAGANIMDGVSGALALAGPIGIVASLGIQAVKAGWALGTMIADGIFDAMEGEHIDGPKQLLPDDFFKALDLQDRDAALQSLISRREEFQDVLENGSDRNKVHAANDIAQIEKQIVLLDKTLERRKLLTDEEARLNAIREAKPIEKQYKLTGDVGNELKLLKAQLAGDEARIIHLKDRAKLEKEMVRLRKSGLVPEEKIFHLASRILELRVKAADAVKKSKDESTELLAVQKRIDALLKKGSEVYVDTLSAEKQLELFGKKKEAILKKSGKGTVKEIFQAGIAEKKKGNLKEAERLLKLGRELQIVEAQIAGTLDKQAAAAKKVADEKKSAADEAEREAQKATRLKEDRGEFATELKALELEAAGRKKDADALREKAALLQRAKELQESLSLSAEKALQLAVREARARRGIEDDSKKEESTKRRGRGIRDVSGSFGKGITRRSGSLIDGIDKRKRGEKKLADRISAKDPSLGFLEKLTDSNAELVGIFKKLGVV